MQCFLLERIMLAPKFSEQHTDRPLFYRLRTPTRMSMYDHGQENEVQKQVSIGYTEIKWKETLFPFKNINPVIISI